MPISFFTLTVLGEQYRSLSSSLCSFLHSLVTSSLLGPNILFITLFSHTLSPRFSLNLKDQAKKRYLDKIYVSATDINGFYFLYLYEAGKFVNTGYWCVISVYLQTKHRRHWYLIWIRWICPNSYIWQIPLHNDAVHIALWFISDGSVSRCMTLISFTLDKSVIIQITLLETSVIHFDGSPKHSARRGGQYVGTASRRVCEQLTPD